MSEVIVSDTKDRLLDIPLAKVDLIFYTLLSVLYFRHQCQGLTPEERNRLTAYYSVFALSVFIAFSVLTSFRITIRLFLTDQIDPISLLIKITGLSGIVSFLFFLTGSKSTTAQPSKDEEAPLKKAEEDSMDKTERKNSSKKTKKEKPKGSDDEVVVEEVVTKRVVKKEPDHDEEIETKRAVSEKLSTGEGSSDLGSPVGSESEEGSVKKEGEAMKGSRTLTGRSLSVVQEETPSELSSPKSRSNSVVYRDPKSGERRDSAPQLDPVTDGSPSKSSIAALAKLTDTLKKSSKLDESGRPLMKPGSTRKPRRKTRRRTLSTEIPPLLKDDSSSSSEKEKDISKSTDTRSREPETQQRARSPSNPQVVSIEEAHETRQEDHLTTSTSSSPKKKRSLSSSSSSSSLYIKVDDTDAQRDTGRRDSPISKDIGESPPPEKLPQRVKEPTTDELNSIDPSTKVDILKSPDNEPRRASMLSNVSVYLVDKIASVGSSIYNHLMPGASSNDNDASDQRSSSTSSSKDPSDSSDDSHQQAEGEITEEIDLKERDSTQSIVNPASRRSSLKESEKRVSEKTNEKDETDPSKLEEDTGDSSRVHSPKGSTSHPESVLGSTGHTGSAPGSPKATKAKPLSETSATENETDPPTGESSTESDPDSTQTLSSTETEAKKTLSEVPGSPTTTTTTTTTTTKEAGTEEDKSSLKKFKGKRVNTTLKRNEKGDIIFGGGQGISAKEDITAAILRKQSELDQEKNNERFSFRKPKITIFKKKKNNKNLNPDLVSSPKSPVSKGPASSSALVSSSSSSTSSSTSSTTKTKKSIFGLGFLSRAKSPPSPVKEKEKEKEDIQNPETDNPSASSSPPGSPKSITTEVATTTPSKPKKKQKGTKTKTSSSADPSTNLESSEGSNSPVDFTKSPSTSPKALEATEETEIDKPLEDQEKDDKRARSPVSFHSTESSQTEVTEDAEIIKSSRHQERDSKEASSHISSHSTDPSHLPTEEDGRPLKKSPLTKSDSLSTLGQDDLVINLSTLSEDARRLLDEHYQLKRLTKPDELPVRNIQQIIRTSETTSTSTHYQEVMNGVVKKAKLQSDLNAHIVSFSKQHGDSINAHHRSQILKIGESLGYLMKDQKTVLRLVAIALSSYATHHSGKKDEFGADLASQLRLDKCWGFSKPIAFSIVTGSYDKSTMDIYRGGSKTSSSSNPQASNRNTNLIKKRPTITSGPNALSSMPLPPPQSNKSRPLPHSSSSPQSYSKSSPPSHSGTPIKVDPNSGSSSDSSTSTTSS